MAGHADPTEAVTGPLLTTVLVKLNESLSKADDGSRTDDREPVHPERMRHEEEQHKATMKLKGLEFLKLKLDLRKMGATDAEIEDAIRGYA